MTNIESDDLCGGALIAPSHYPDVDLLGHNAIQGYVTPHPAIPSLLLQPGIVLIAVLATNVAASSAYAYLAPNTFLLLSVERHFSLVVNLVLAVGFLLLFIAGRCIGRHTAHLQQAAKAGFAMALLTGPVLYISLGRNAFGPILLLVLALYISMRGLREVYRHRESPLLDTGGEALSPPLLCHDQ